MHEGKTAHDKTSYDTCIISLLYEKTRSMLAPQSKLQIRINLVIDLGRGSAVLFPLIEPLTPFSTGSLSAQISSFLSPYFLSASYRKNKFH